MRGSCSSIQSCRYLSVVSILCRSYRTPCLMATTNSGCQKNGSSTRSVAVLPSSKDEDDGDYHLVITDDSLAHTPGGPGTNGLETGTSFIAEIPDPAW